MSESWKKVTSSKSARWISQVEQLHTEFIEFLGKHYPKAKEMSDVSEAMARAFMAIIEAEGFAPGTFNNKLDMLRSTFNYLRGEAGVVLNPFNCIEEQEDAIVNRIPFTELELELILEVAARPQHALVFPAIVAASQTAMRRADCCLLLKTAIDLVANKIRVRMAKTKKTIDIPITTKLRELLDSLPESDSQYVFPDCAREFLRSPDSITDRTRKVFKDAGFFNPTANGPKPTDSVQVKREEGRGVRAASTRDFQALRATWVTLALTSGLDIETVMAITGHTSEDTLRRHYFLPRLETIRNNFKKLPRVIGGVRDGDSESSASFANFIAQAKKLSPAERRLLQKELFGKPASKKSARPKTA